MVMTAVAAAATTMMTSTDDDDDKSVAMANELKEEHMCGRHLFAFVIYHAVCNNVTNIMFLHNKPYAPTYGNVSQHNKAPK